MRKRTDPLAFPVETYPRVQPCTVDWQWQKIIKEARHDPGRRQSDARNCSTVQRHDGRAAGRNHRETSQVLQVTLEAYGIDTRLRIAHFLGQTCHESAGFRTTEEFASGEAYEGRKDLGNIKKGDGRRYKGRGLLQLTGRANYAEHGKMLGVDLETIRTWRRSPRCR